MGLTDRLHRARKQREAREARVEGFEVALGLPVQQVPQPAGNLGTDDGRHCPSCGAAGRVELLDLVGDRTAMRCPSCTTAWDVDHRITIGR